MPDWVWFLVAVPATWRLTHILYSERIAKGIRSFFKIGHDANGQVVSWPDTFFGHLLGCSWCLSVWVGALFTLMIYVAPVVLLPFALSAASIWIEEWMD